MTILWFSGSINFVFIIISGPRNWHFWLFLALALIQHSFHFLPVSFKRNICHIHIGSHYIQGTSRQPRKLIFNMQPYLNLTWWNMEDYLILFVNGRQPNIFFSNDRRPKLLFVKGRQSHFFKGYNLNFLLYGRKQQYSCELMPTVNKNANNSFFWWRVRKLKLDLFKKRRLVEVWGSLVHSFCLTFIVWLIPSGWCPYSTPI